MSHLIGCVNIDILHSSGTSLFRRGHCRLSTDFIGGLGCIGNNITHGIVSLHLKVSQLLVKLVKNLDLRNRPVMFNVPDAVH